MDGRRFEMAPLYWSGMIINSVKMPNSIIILDNMAIIVETGNFKNICLINGIWWWAKLSKKIYIILTISFHRSWHSSNLILFLVFMSDIP